MWVKCLKSLKYFSMTNANMFFKKEKQVDSHFKRGYKYFCDGYISDIWTSVDNKGMTSVKATSFRSQRRNEKPHKLFMIINNINGCIAEAHCSCLIGLTECCGHLVGLAFTLEHFILKELDVVPSELTCTDLPQKWGKPRGNKIESECVMNLKVNAPSLKIKKYPINCTLRENIFKCTSNLVSGEAIQKTTEKLQSINSAIGFAYLLNIEETEIKQPLPLNLIGQDTCVLEYQLNNSCYRDQHNARSQLPISQNVFYKDYPIIHSHSVLNAFKNTLKVLPQLCLTYAEAVNLEKSTRAQSNSIVWKNHRVNRFTASVFGEIYHRKKRPNEPFLSRICGHSNKDISEISSIKHGRKYESIAIELYKSAKQNVDVYDVGLIVQPDLCFLGATPDGHLVDQSEIGRENGVLEIKCPMWDQLSNGLEKKNGFIHLCENKGEYLLNENSNYYSQVQGQMLVSGSLWCDFVIYIQKSEELNIQRIYFNENYCSQMIHKLSDMYLNFALPYILNSDKENVD